MSVPVRMYCWLKVSTVSPRTSLMRATTAACAVYVAFSLFSSNDSWFVFTRTTMGTRVLPDGSGNTIAAAPMTKAFGGLPLSSAAIAGAS